MPSHFKVGDHVTWNSEAGHVSGYITKVHTKDFDPWRGKPRGSARVKSAASDSWP